MKVVLFCGGLGMRIREHTEAVPKPMINLGYRPILWHIMRYYAHFGHRDFVLCLGYKGDVIKKYFLDYDEAISNDFILSLGRGRRDLLSSDADDWSITFSDTGLRANIGQRLLAVRPYLGDDDIFLANYGDVLTDAPLDEFMERFKDSGKVGAFLTVRPTYSFHVVASSDDGLVRAIRHVGDTDIWLNGGYFIFRREIFNYIKPGDELVEEPFRRLIAAGLLMTFRYNGFWAPMDTLKDMQELEDSYNSGEAPWAVWANRAAPAVAGVRS